MLVVRIFLFLAIRVPCARDTLCMGRGEANPTFKFEDVTRVGFPDAFYDLEWRDRRGIRQLLESGIRDLLDFNETLPLMNAYCRESLEEPLTPEVEKLLMKSLKDFVDVALPDAGEEFPVYMRRLAAFTRFLPMKPSSISMITSGDKQGEWHIYSSPFSKEAICGHKQSDRGEFKAHTDVDEIYSHMRCEGCEKEGVKYPTFSLANRYALDIIDPWNASESKLASVKVANELREWLGRSGFTIPEALDRVMKHEAEDRLLKHITLKASEWYATMTPEERFGCLYYGAINSSNASIGGVRVLGRCVETYYSETIPWPNEADMHDALYEAQKQIRYNPLGSSFLGTNWAQKEYSGLVHLTATVFPEAMKIYLMQTEQRDKEVGDLVAACYPSLYRDGVKDLTIAEACIRA
jgi:hypothetical protein